ncbi:bifunctional diguanylate cyclase/phosphodiesterase [Luteimonas aestuarii]|nr:EAL domain-containing protein [Luteimonas aestuarii]
MVRTVGVVLGVVLMVGLAVLLLQDRKARIDAAHRQSLALATGVDRLLYFGLRNLERAMAGISADAEVFATTAPEQAQALLVDGVEGVVSRHAELHSIVLVDARGQAMTSGEGDPDLPGWATPMRSAGRLLVGPLQADGDGGWWLRLAFPFGQDQWLLSRLHASEFERMIRDLDIGRDGSVTMLDQLGTVLARVQNGGNVDFAGRRIQLPDQVRDATGTASLRMVSQLDGVERTAGFSGTNGYGVLVAAGIGLDEALTPWMWLVALASAIVALYWMGLGYLVYRLATGERARDALLDELEAQADWLDQAQQAASTGVWRLESDDMMIRVSAHTAAIFGLAPEAAVLPADRFFERMHPEDRARVEQAFAESRGSGTPYLTEYRVLLDDGSERWISARGGVAGSGRAPGRLAGTVVDITSRRLAQARIERAEAQFRALFERNPLPFWVFDVATLRFIAVNQAAVAAYGYSVREFLEKTILDIRPPEDRPALMGAMRQRTGDQDVDGVWTHVRKDGSRLDVRIFSSSIEFGGRPARLVLAEDISDRMTYERDLAWRATHDSTTGLETVEALTDRLDRRAADALGARYAVAYVRLRELELVAPTLGRSTSELLLREMAERISLVGETFGLAGYWPSESFVVVALDASRRHEMLAALEEAIAMPVHTEGGAHPVEASIGIAEGPEPGEGAEQVIGHAALAALKAWQEQTQALPYDHAMAEEAAERLALARSLRDAIDNREFELHYQPIRRLEDNRLVSVEALLRWRRPGGGHVPPATFIPLAEASGLIVPIGRWVLAEAALGYRRLAAHGHGDVAVAINISAVQLLGDGLPDAIRSVQAEHGLPVGALHVELTESVVVRRPQVARARMLELRSAGVRISIDDFGTGFSSMAYLRNLPLDCLKIDRSFVQNVHADERNASICRALIALARGLGLGTIAEGVEREEELEWLRRNGCEQAQGYHLGRPAPLDDLLQALRAAA